MNAVQLVTIKSLRTLFKNGEAASRIELANVEEHNFDVVVQKDLYKIGDKAVYIQPDFCLPLSKEGIPNSKATQLFLDFTMPEGDVKKSKLGKNGRIRAIKFNFQLSGSSDPVYSVGIMMPFSIVAKEIPRSDYEEKFIAMENSVGTDGFIDTIFEVTKYEEPETAHSGMAKGALPSGMYTTDETNIRNLTRLQWPITLIGTQKIDGSSITIYYKDAENYGICSRNLEKKADQCYISGYTLPDGRTVRKHYDKEYNVHCWAGVGNAEDQTVECYLEADPSWVPIYTEVDDTFVKIGTPILEKLKKYCEVTKSSIALRGELNGEGLKGSGNKNNPSIKEKQNIKFFAVDDYSSGVTKQVPISWLFKICADLNITMVPVIFNDVTFNSYEELIAYCEEYFKDHMIEGIVVKDLLGRFSAKVMNNEYDSKK